MELSDFLEDLVVVIVLFRLKPGNSTAYNSLRSATNITPDIFIYDNSPEPALEIPEGVTYIHDPGSSGLSRGYNAASRHAEKKKKRWMLLLDQDTCVEDALFETLLEAVTHYQESVAFVPRMSDGRGLVSPFYFSGGRGKRLKTTPGALPLDKYRFINSGLLIRHATFLAAGGYDESIPLDFSDISFGERLAKITGHFRVIDVTLRHSFSNNERTSVDVALRRFDYFCKGAFAMGRNGGLKKIYFMRALLRAMRLCFRYKDFRFLIRLLHYPRND